MSNFRPLRRKRAKPGGSPSIDVDDFESDPALNLSPTVTGGISLGPFGSGTVEFNPLQFAMGRAASPFQIDDRHAEGEHGEPVGRTEHLRLETMWEAIVQSTEATALNEFEQWIIRASETAEKLARLILVSEEDRIADEQLRDDERLRHKHLRDVLGVRQATRLYILARNPWTKAGFVVPDTALAAVVLSGLFPNLTLSLLGGASVAFGTVAAGTLAGEAAKTASSRTELGERPETAPAGAHHLYAAEGSNKSWMLGVPLVQATVVTAMLGSLGMGAGESPAKSFGAAGLLGLSALGSFALAWLGHEPVVEAIEASAASVQEAERVVQGHRRREMEAAAAIARLNGLLEAQLSAAAAAFKAAVAIGKAAIAHVAPSLTSYVDKEDEDRASAAHEFERKVKVPTLPARGSNSGEAEPRHNSDDPAGGEGDEPEDHGGQGDDSGSPTPAPRQPADVPSSGSKVAAA
jgi:hypothetical protein